MVKAKKYFIVFLAVSILTVLLDQFSKYAVDKIRPEWGLGFMSIHFVHNTGAGFGILKGQTGLLAFISALAALAVIFFYKKIPQEKIPQILFGLFLGGVVGNLIDRTFRGYVIDFFDLSFWPVFNIADMAISLSVIGLALYYWKK
ncbi:MAG: signal peptidase II [Nanoarchaeota archaeon]